MRSPPSQTPPKAQTAKPHRTRSWLGAKSPGFFHTSSKTKAMFRHSSSSSPSSYSDALMHHHAATFSAAAALSVTVPRAAAGYLDGGGNVGAAFSPPPPSSGYSSSLPSSYPYYSSIQRSISSHSLPMHLQLSDGVSLGGGFYSPSSSPSTTTTHQQLTTATTLPPPQPLSSSPSSSSGEFFEFTSSCPVRRVFSTGDLQGMNGSSPPRPAASSADGGCGQEGGGGPFSQKVGRYSAEERKERIERYRVKRHQRNFNKKITYACRKTLADSRPRVKGRFARNGEADAEYGDEREASGDNSSYEYGYDNSSSSSKLNGGGISAFSGGDNGEWWWRAPGATAAAAAGGDDDDDEGQRQQQQQQRQVVVGFDDEDELWATLGDMLSVNLASS